MKIFVVNLFKDIERRNSIELQFNKINLSFTFINAVYGKELSEIELSECYNDKKAKRTQCRSLTPAEIGCAYSHINIYKKMVKDKIHTALILEDDVVIPENLSTVLLELEPMMSNDSPQVILLSPVLSFEKENDVTVVNKTYNLLKFKNGYYTSSYIVNLYAAKTLLKELYPIGDVADCWSRLKRHKIVNISALNPPLIYQDQEEFGSSTTTDILKHQKIGFLSKISYKFKRAFWLGLDFILAFYNRKFRNYGGVKL